MPCRAYLPLVAVCASCIITFEGHSTCTAHLPIRPQLRGLGLACWKINSHCPGAVRLAVLCPGRPINFGAPILIAFGSLSVKLLKKKKNLEFQKNYLKTKRTNRAHIDWQLFREKLISRILKRSLFTKEFEFECRFVKCPPVAASGAPQGESGGGRSLGATQAPQSACGKKRRHTHTHTSTLNTADWAQTALGSVPVALAASNQWMSLMLMLLPLPPLPPHSLAAARWLWARRICALSALFVFWRVCVCSFVSSRIAATTTTTTLSPSHEHSSILVYFAVKKSPHSHLSIYSGQKKFPLSPATLHHGRSAVEKA